MQMRPIDSSERLAKRKKHTHTCTQAAWDPTLTDPIQLFVHLCLRGSKIKTRAFSLIRPLSSSRVWRRNGVGTMTPHRWRLTPSPNAADGTTKTGPHLTCTPASSSSLTPPLQKNLSGWDPHPPDPPPHTAVIAPGGSGPPKNSTLSPLCVSFSFSPGSLSLQDR